MLTQKAKAYENIMKSIQWSEEIEYGDPTEDANGVVLFPGATLVTYKLSFDPLCILEQCGITMTNPELLKFEFIR